MKTEKEITKKLIDNIGCDVDIWREQETHLASLKRELEFLEHLGKLNRVIEMDEGRYFWNDQIALQVRDRITDIKQAIKVYERGGLK